MNMVEFHLYELVRRQVLSVIGVHTSLRSYIDQVANLFIAREIKKGRVSNCQSSIDFGL